MLIGQRSQTNLHVQAGVEASWRPRHNTAIVPSAALIACNSDENWRLQNVWRGRRGLDTDTWAGRLEPSGHVLNTFYNYGNYTTLTLTHIMKKNYSNLIVD